MADLSCGHGPRMMICRAVATICFWRKEQCFFFDSVWASFIRPFYTKGPYTGTQRLKHSIFPPKTPSRFSDFTVSTSDANKWRSLPGGSAAGWAQAPKGTAAAVRNTREEAPECFCDFRHCNRCKSHQYDNLHIISSQRSSSSSIFGWIWCYYLSLFPSRDSTSALTKQGMRWKRNSAQPSITVHPSPGLSGRCGVSWPLCARVGASPYQAWLEAHRYYKHVHYY